jgi:hypothetical protein
MILNESAVKYMGLKNPIGARVSYVAGMVTPIFSCDRGSQGYGDAIAFCAGEAIDLHDR